MVCSQEAVDDVRNAIQAELEMRKLIPMGHVGVVVTAPSRDRKSLDISLSSHAPDEPLGPVLARLSERAIEDRIVSACVIRRTGENSFEDLVTIYAG